MNKEFQWNRFSDIVANHIHNYVIKQYGDLPDKMVSGYTPEKIQMKLEHYVGRIGNIDIERAKRDCLKIAHYSCYLFAILETGDPQNNLLDCQKLYIPDKNE